MRFDKAFIPAGGAWSSPFARWQGPFSDISSLDLAVTVTRRALDERAIPTKDITEIVLGWTVPQRTAFYGAPTVAARIGAESVTGPMVSQACATSAASLSVAAATIEAGEGGVILVITTDRTSNGPHVVYPEPNAAGGTARSEDWVMDSFRCDPWADNSMLETAERVAAEVGLTRAVADEVALLRHEQYQRSLDADRQFQRRYLVPVTIPSKKGEPTVVDRDLGIYPTTKEGLAKLGPVTPDGIHTYAGQTHPADGAAGMIVTTRDMARRLGSGEGTTQILAYGIAREQKGMMPKAPVPAAESALAAAGLDFTDLDAVTTHNPFVVNDVWFSHSTGIPVEDVNLYGSSLVYGHPQGPTGSRAIAELIEVLRLRGGGIGLFTGCAAGDTGAAVVLRVDD